MKRQIKFRAWIEKDNVMISHREVIERAHLQFEGKLNHNDIVMQFTGLQDIKGKYIYEGDILKVKWKKDSKNGYLQMSDSYIEYKEVVFVSYLKLSFVFILNNGKYFNLPKSCTINIIGNIYENPELLKTTENE